MSQTRICLGADEFKLLNEIEQHLRKIARAHITNDLEERLEALFIQTQNIDKRLQFLEDLKQHR